LERETFITVRAKAEKRGECTVSCVERASERAREREIDIERGERETFRERESMRETKEGIGTRRDGGREGEDVLRVTVLVGARWRRRVCSANVHPLGDSTRCSVPDSGVSGAHVPKILIVGWLYSVTALRKNDHEGHGVY